MTRLRDTAARVRTWRPSMPSGERLLGIGAWLLVLVFAGRLAQTLLELGGNTPTGDDIWPIQRFIVPALDGSFEWSRILMASFNNGQLQAGAFVVYYLVAHLFDLDYFVFGTLGVVLGLLRIVLVHDMLRRTLPASRLVPLATVFMAALTFGYGQIALYEFDVTAVPFGVGMTTFVIAAWGIVRWPGRWYGATIAAVGITLGCLTSGLGPLACPPLLLTAWVAGVRTRKGWLIILGSMAANAALYLYLYHSAGAASVQSRIGDSYSIDVVYSLMGLPFGGASLPQTFEAGRVSFWIAIAASAVLAIGCIRRWFTLREAAAPLALMSFGVMCLLQLYVLRGVAVQYYAYPSMFIWMAIVATVLLLTRHLRRPTTPGLRPRLVSLTLLCVVAAPLAVVTSYSWSANQTVEDKMLFSRWRTEVSEACIRHYRIAPTTCEQDLVPWATARLPEFVTALAKPLESERLGPFGRQQRWSLQGEWILPTVQDEYGEIGWVRGVRAAPESFRTALRLNLALMGDAGVTWHMRVPEDGAATFATRVTAAETPATPGAHSTLRIRVESNGEVPIERAINIENGIVDWRHVKINLERFRGRDISVHFDHDDPDSQVRDDVILDRPHVDVDFDDAIADFAHDDEMKEASADAQRLPVEPSAQGDAFTTSVTVRDAKLTGEERHGLPVWSAPEAKQPRFTYRLRRPVCARDFSAVSFTMGIDPPWAADPHDLVYENHAAKVYVRLVGMEDFDETRVMIIPFLLTDFSQAPQATPQELELFRKNMTEDELKPHHYSYPLRALGLPRGARIDAIAFAPYQLTMRDTTNRFVVDEFELVRSSRNRSSDCG